MKSLTLAYIAEHIGAEFAGDGSCQVSAIAPLQTATGSDLTFFDNAQYRDALRTTQAGVVILPAKHREDYPGSNIILSDNPCLSYAKAAELFQEKTVSFRGRHATVVIGASSDIADDVVLAPHVVIGDRVHLGKGVVIGPNVVIGNDVTIADGSLIKANVTICDKVTIGARCIIHPGAVIGSDGFGNARDGAAWHKVPQLGGVTIGDDVEIGANTTIDCGAIDDTIIARGVRLDNQIQIAHNVKIGENTAIAAGTGIAGSTTIGKNCLVGGNVGMTGHITIADQVIITGMAMVTHSLTESGVYSSGIPVAKSREWRRNVVHFKQLDTIVKRIKQLEKNES